MIVDLSDNTDVLDSWISHNFLHFSAAETQIALITLYETTIEKINYLGEKIGYLVHSWF